MPYHSANTSVQDYTDYTDCDNSISQNVDNTHNTNTAMNSHEYEESDSDDEIPEVFRGAIVNINSGSGQFGSNVGFGTINFNYDPMPPSPLEEGPSNPNKPPKHHDHDNQALVDEQSDLVGPEVGDKSHDCVSDGIMAESLCPLQEPTTSLSSPYRPHPSMPSHPSNSIKYNPFRNGIISAPPVPHPSNSTLVPASRVRTKLRLVYSEPFNRTDGGDSFSAAYADLL